MNTEQFTIFDALSVKILRPSNQKKPCSGGRARFFKLPDPLKCWGTQNYSFSDSEFPIQECTSLFKYAHDGA